MNTQHKGTLFTKALNNKGVSLLSAIILSLVTGISIAVISSQVPWGFKFSLKLNHSVPIPQLMDYTSNFILTGLKNRWCFEDNLTKKAATDCNLLDQKSSERILLHQGLSNPDSTLSHLLRMIKANKTTVEGKAKLLAMGLPIDPNNITSVPLPSFEFNLSESGIKDSALKDAFAAVTGVRFTRLEIRVKHFPSYVPVNKEVHIELIIKLTTFQDSTEKIYELKSTNIFFPRELNSFALISGRDLWLGTSSSATANPIVGESDVCKPSSSTDSIVNFDTANLSSALVFQSPVYVHGDVHLPSNNKQLPLSFNSLILGNKGKLKVLNNNYEPDFSKGFKYKNSIGSLFSKIQVESEDKGLSVLSGKAACKDARLGKCNSLQKITLGKMKVKKVETSGPLSVSAGGNHTCAIKANGQLKCWGKSRSGQTEIPDGLEFEIQSVSAGGNHTCAIKANGELKCWGENSDRKSTVPLGFSTGTQSVSAGGNHTCAITARGELKCWGSNSDGQGRVPTEDFINRLVPVPPLVKDNNRQDEIYGKPRDSRYDRNPRCWKTLEPPAKDFMFTAGTQSVSAGDNHTCAITAKGELKCWGNNSYDQTDVPPEDFIIGTQSVSSGGNHTCAITARGKLECWGSNSYNQGRVPLFFLSDFSTGTQSVSTGKNHTCAITAKGKLKCWGNNSYRQSTVPPGFDTGTYSVSAGEKHTCAIKADGELKCWGFNGNDRATVPKDIISAAKYRTVFKAASSHFCAVTTNGQLKCWGRNHDGQTNIPEGFKFGTRFASTGSQHTCAIKADGELKCWGSNLYGQTKIPEGFKFGTRSVAAGGGQTCAIKADGEVKCWGWRKADKVDSGLSFGARSVATEYSDSCAITAEGRLRCWGIFAYGSGSKEHYAIETAKPCELFDSGTRSVSMGSQKACAITARGKLKCWGERGKQGLPKTPGNLSSEGAVRSVSMDDDHGCAVKINGEVQCWADDSSNSQTRDGQPIIPTDFNSSIRSVALGPSVTCVTKANGEVKCWWNRYGGTAKVPPLTDIIPAQYHQGANHTCVILKTPGSVTHADNTLDTENGELRCWGNNEYGQIGNGVDLTNPEREMVSGSVQVGKTKFSSTNALNRNVTHFSLGYGHSCAIKDKSLKCWGLNDYGQLGNGTTANQSLPVQVRGLSNNVIQVSAGKEHTCAIVALNKKDSFGLKGKLMCWGRNHYGQLGNNTTTNHSIPELVVGLESGVTFVSVGADHTCAVHNETLKCWGRNNYGQLGLGTGNLGFGDHQKRIRPAEVFPSGATNVSAGEKHTCAIHEGLVKCWGSNASGQLGNGTRIRKSTVPVLVLGMEKAEGIVSAGKRHSCAIDNVTTTTGSTNKVLKCWGKNDKSQLGKKPNKADQRTATQVTGLTKKVLVIATGGDHSCSIKDTGNALKPQLTLNCWGGDNEYGQVDAGEGNFDKNNYATFGSCSPLGDANSLGIALWTDDFSPYSRLSWEFTNRSDQGGYKGLTKEFTETDSKYTAGTMDLFDSKSQIRSIIPRCIIKATANFVVGLYFCDEFIIEARTTPLKIVGTVITNRLNVHATAVQAGITWSSLTHPQGVNMLKRAGILRATNTPKKLCPVAHGFSNFLNAKLRSEAYNCSSSSLITAADPFRWTTVDPDCGVNTATAFATKCKRHLKRFIVKQIKQSKNY